MAICACTPATENAPPEAASPAAIHERLLTLDTHLDTPLHFSRRGWDIADRHDYANDISQVDLPRMEEGGLDGGFFVIYTAQGELTPEGYAGARAAATRRQQDILDMAAANPGAVELAYSADDAARIAGAGKVFAFQSIENSWPLGEDIGALEGFYERGVRMAGPVHSRDNQFADSTTGEGRWGGLSPLGRELVAEMNRLGIVVDGSHASDAAFDQMIELSATPLILSHSGPRAIFDHKRNIDDARIRRLAESGGAICVNSIFLAPFLESEELTAIEERMANYAELPVAEQQALVREYRAAQTRAPQQEADFDAFMASLLHLIEIAGVDHVCMGADWDGGGGVIGMRDIAALPQITERLLAEGYSEEDLQKLWSGNVLRLLRQAEAHAARSRQ
ncbi:MAG: dipeptidase [Parasphingopyxis sp.]